MATAARRLPQERGGARSKRDNGLGVEEGASQELGGEDRAE